MSEPPGLAPPGTEQHSQHPAVFHQTLQLGETPGTVLNPFFMSLRGHRKVEGGWIFPGKERKSQTSHGHTMDITSEQSSTSPPPNHPTPSAAAAAPAAQILQASQKSITHFLHPTSKNSLIQHPPGGEGAQGERG